MVGCGISIGVCVCSGGVCVFLRGEDRERVSGEEGSPKSGTASDMLQCDTLGVRESETNDYISKLDERV